MLLGQMTMLQCEWLVHKGNYRVLLRVALAAGWETDEFAVWMSDNASRVGHYGSVTMLPLWETVLQKMQPMMMFIPREGEWREWGSIQYDQDDQIDEVYL
jgi:hypothetical protein